MAADREQGGERLIVEAGQRVTKRGERRRVQPLDVIDREAEGTIGGENSQRPKECACDRALIGMDLGLPKQQCGLERAPLDRRQLGQHVCSRFAEEVGQPRERERGLGL